MALSDSVDQVVAELQAFVDEAKIKAEASAVQILTSVSEWCDAKVAELGAE